MQFQQPRGGFRLLELSRPCSHVRSKRRHRLRHDEFAGLLQLIVVRRKSCFHGCATRPKCGTRPVGQRFEWPLVLFRAADTATARRDSGCREQIRDDPSDTHVPAPHQDCSTIGDGELRFELRISRLVTPTACEGLPAIRVARRWPRRRQFSVRRHLRYDLLSTPRSGPPRPGAMQDRLLETEICGSRRCVWMVRSRGSRANNKVFLRIARDKPIAPTGLHRLDASRVSAADCGRRRAVTALTAVLSVVREPKSGLVPTCLDQSPRRR
jgi:hypothetical protein